MVSMDRMLLDLNLPPPAHWSPQAAPAHSSVTRAPSSPIENASRKGFMNVEKLEHEVADDIPDVEPQSVVDKAEIKAVEKVESGPSLDPSPVILDTNECEVVSDLKRESSSGSSPAAEKLEDQSSEKSTPVSPQPERVGSGADLVTGPSLISTCDLEDQVETPRFVSETGLTDKRLAGEVPSSGGGPVKVHKRLRTLGQLRSRRVEKTTVDSVSDDLPVVDVLEDGIPPQSNLSTNREEISTSVRASRAPSQLEGKRGDKRDNATRDATVSGNISREPSETDVGGKHACKTGGPFQIGGRFPKIPSQPRSRKPEKRAKLIPPIVISEARRDDVEMKAQEYEGKHSVGSSSGNGSGKGFRVEKPSFVNANGGEASIAEEKPEELKEQSKASQDTAQAAGPKKVGAGLKDAMPGKRRRQTVLLEVDESIKQARPLKTPTGDGGPGRLSRCRRDVSRVASVQMLENQENHLGNDAAASSSQIEEASTPRPEESNGEAPKVEKVLRPQASEGTGQFRRPSLKRQSSAVSVRDEVSLTGSHSYSRADVKDLRSVDVKIDSASDGQELQKPRRMPRKADVKKQAPGPQDTSVERLHREATCSKLWQNSGTADLEQVPGRFESVDDYVRVLEPLLFEECRAQLHSSWEELLEGNVKDAHIPVFVKGVERRERGWYDVIVLPEHPHMKFKFKEGDVAVLSTPNPVSAGRYHKGKNKGGVIQEKDGSVTGRITGIVRRYYPTDTRDPPGAALHFHVSQDEGDSTSFVDSMNINGNVMKDLDVKGVTWYLTVLGGVTTTQREYIALHCLQQFHPKMLNAVLQPRPELFPGYADQEPPAMPECFTAAFVQHLHDHFNGPQLAAIQWAGAHTAAGSGSNVGIGGGPKPDPWPFTLVQGPPGTGKTHTVWGMLNVIHLVQYQRYYQALLKKLAPGSLTSEESSSPNLGNFETGSIEDLLQRMDDSLARMLPKLCPKPRMLVCAPSNAATDELLSRVLDRGFIDGEMKVYRPDVARVGSDPHSRAAQAVSVERRSEQLLGMGRDQVLGWLQQLRGKEVNCSQLITSLQRDLAEVANTRSQGNLLGIDPEKLAARDQARDTKLQQLAALVEDRDKILVEMTRLWIVEGRFRPGSGFSPEDARQKLEASFANEAEIVFTTVSSSGRRIFTKLAHGFDMVVIDEAAQASEVAVLPPLSLRAARCVLVGDPQQLPATVISRVADTMQYSRSLFERFQQAGCPAILLSVQYRMHPQIRDFPSRYFYQGRLVDSQSVKEKPDEVYHKEKLLQPYLFYDISEGRESHGGSVSYQNKLEAQVAVRLYLHLQKAVAEGGTGSVSVGMITPYKQQLRCLQSEFEALVGSNAESKGVYINTVDAFQGQERDVIMMSCVRASTHGVGFVADIRRMNVALTRARRSLWVIGNATALLQSEDWAALLADARSRGSVVETSACIAQGLLPDPAAGISAGAGTSQAAPGPGLGRQQTMPIFSRRREFPSTFGRPQAAGHGHFGSEFEGGRQQNGNEADRWPNSDQRSSRLHQIGSRSVNLRSLPPNRSFGGRGSHLSFRRGR